MTTMVLAQRCIGRIGEALTAEALTAEARQRRMPSAERRAQCVRACVRPPLPAAALARVHDMCKHSYAQFWVSSFACRGLGEGLRQGYTCDSAALEASSDTRSRIRRSLGGV